MGLFIPKESQGSRLKILLGKIIVLIHSKEKKKKPFLRLQCREGQSTKHLGQVSRSKERYKEEKRGRGLATASVIMPGRLDQSQVTCCLSGRDIGTVISLFTMGPGSVAVHWKGQNQGLESGVNKGSFSTQKIGLSTQSV